MEIKREKDWWLTYKNRKTRWRSALQHPGDDENKGGGGHRCGSRYLVITGWIEERKEKDLDSRANRVQREEGRTVGSTRVTVTAAAFKQRGTLGSRRTKKTRTKTCYKKREKRGTEQWRNPERAVCYLFWARGGKLLTKMFVTSAENPCLSEACFIVTMQPELGTSCLIPYTRWCKEFMIGPCSSSPT